MAEHLFSRRGRVGTNFSEPVLVASSKGNEWNPAIRSRFEWPHHGGVGLRSKRQLRRLSTYGGEWKVGRGDAGGRNGAVRSVPVDRIRAERPGAWLAYEEAHERWGKDYGSDESTGVALYVGRAVCLRGYEVSGKQWSRQPIPEVFCLGVEPTR